MLSHPNATLAPQAMQARPSGEILNYSLSCFFDILSMIIVSLKPKIKYQNFPTFRIMVLSILSIHCFLIYDKNFCDSRNCFY